MYVHIDRMKDIILPLFTLSSVSGNCQLLSTMLHRLAHAEVTCSQKLGLKGALV